MALSISRRSFMKCVGITALATATGTLMTGCATGNIMGSFGMAATLEEDGNSVASITINTFDWSPFDISGLEISNVLKDEVGVDLSLPDFDLTGISSVLGVGCGQIKGVIQNTSDSTLLVLPYFTGEMFDELVDDFVIPKVKENTDTIKGTLQKYLSNDEVNKTLAEELNKLVASAGSVASILGNALKEIIKQFYKGSDGQNNFVNDIPNGKTILQGSILTQKLPWGTTLYVPDEDKHLPGLDQLIPESDRPQLLADIESLLQKEVLDKAGDLFRILMVQGRFNGQSGESTLDQALNAAAAGYSLVKNPSSTLMLRTISSDSYAAGSLAIPANRSWSSLQLMFYTRKLNIALTSGWLDWDNATTLIAEILGFYVFGANAHRLVTPIVDLVPSLVDHMDISVNPTGGQSWLDFQNSFLL